MEVFCHKTKDAGRIPPTAEAVHRSFMLATVIHPPPSKVLHDVPQGSVLGPVLYVLYTSDVARLGEALGLGAHLYADDTQLYGHCSLANFFELAYRVLRAIDSVPSKCPRTGSLSQNGQDTIHWYEAKSCQERCGSALQSTSVPD